MSDGSLYLSFEDSPAAERSSAGVSVTPSAPATSVSDSSSDTATPLPR